VNGLNGPTSGLLGRGATRASVDPRATTRVDRRRASITITATMAIRGTIQSGDAGPGRTRSGDHESGTSEAKNDCTA
jgi:hypothetical protein